MSSSSQPGGGGGGEQAQSYFLERQNSYHQNLYHNAVAIGNGNGNSGSSGKKAKTKKAKKSKAAKKEKHDPASSHSHTPVVDNSIRKSSSTSLFSTSSSSIKSGNENEEGGTDDIDIELGIRKHDGEEQQAEAEQDGGQNNMMKPLLAQQQQQQHRGGGNFYSGGGSSSSSSRSSSYGSLLLGHSTRSPPPPLPPKTLQNTNTTTVNTIRFQVVVWNIGKLDVVTGSVPMTFRVSLFWNDIIMPGALVAAATSSDGHGADEEQTDDDYTVEEDDGEEDDDDDDRDILSMDESSITRGDGDNDNENDVSKINTRSSVRGSVRSVATAATTATTTASMTTTWKMHGRSKAIQQDIGGSGGLIIQPSHVQQSQSQSQSQGTAGPSIIEVPPLSILNVATFETIGGAEIDMLCAESRLFRWTAMYRATVLQKDVGVENFPHDMHDVEIKLAILSQRSLGRQWDSRLWKLDLATEEDSQFSTRVPYGLIVDQVKIPGFTYNKDRGLQFDFVPLNHGSSGNSNQHPSSLRSSLPTATSPQQTISSSRTSTTISSSGRSTCARFANNTNCNQGGHRTGHDDEYLRVSVTVLRESGYYDMNIVPLVALLNVVAVSVLTFQDTEFFYRALITLNIAFVEMSIRIQADGHLPSVGYQIKLQRLLNEWFVILMMLVLEGMLVYVLVTYFNVNQSITKTLDWITGLSALGHNTWRVTTYYQSKQEALNKLEQGTTSRFGADGDGNDHQHLAKKTS